MTRVFLLRVLAAFVANTLFCIYLFPQERNDFNWIFSNRSSGFGGLIPATIFDFYNESKYHDTLNVIMGRTNASVTSREGKLLFYTNGCQVIQSDHQLMANGDSLNFGKYYVEWWDNCSDGYNGWQDIIILTDPNNSNGYYIIHKICNFILSPYKFWIDDLRYSYVDMSMNNGKGKVTKKNIIVHDNDNLVWSFLTAAHHQNGKDWWLIQFNRYDNLYYKYLLDKDGISIVDSQRIGNPTTLNTSASGFAKFSPDGKKWAWFTTENGLNLFDFNRETGELSNFNNKKIKHRRVFTGIEFSPNSRFIYLSLHDSLLQVDTWKENLPFELIDTFDFGENGFANFFGMSIAPDCKIYITSSNSTYSLSRINYPNKKGKDCKFIQHEVPLFATNNIGIPNFPRLRVDEEDICDSIELYTDVVDEVHLKSPIKIYPNPIYDIAKVESETNGLLYLNDLRGTLIKKQKVHRGDNYLDMEACVSGIYLVRFVDEKGREYNAKLVKINDDK